VSSRDLIVKAVGRRRAGHSAGARHLLDLARAPRPALREDRRGTPPPINARELRSVNAHGSPGAPCPEAERAGNIATAMDGHGREIQKFRPPTQPRQLGGRWRHEVSGLAAR
jgi:hypothetical protein